MSRTTVLAALTLAALCVPTIVQADETGAAGAADVPQRPLSMLQPVVVGRYEPPDDEFSGLSAEQDWQRRHSWRFGEDRLFSLTRGMEDAGIPEMARWPLYPFTAAFDFGNAVFSAIGGLYGD